LLGQPLRYSVAAAYQRAVDGHWSGIEGEH